MLGDFALSNKIVLVTGGGSGIGLAFCKLALAANAKVIIADLRLTPEAEELTKVNESVVFTSCNVGKWNEIEALIPFSEKTFGDVPDVYAANAGISEGPRSGFWHDAESEQYALLNVNLVHPIKLTRVGIRALLRKKKKGVIIITSSIAGVNGHYGTPLYVASKHGTIGLIRSLARADEEANVKVVGVCPGLVATSLLKDVMDGNTNTASDSKLMDPNDIATEMMNLVQQGKYPGGTALGVYKPGEARVVADGSYSELENIAPTDMESIRSIMEAESG